MHAFFHYPKHSHNYIEMSYVYGGTMTHIIDGKEIKVNEGELILLNRILNMKYCSQEKMILFLISLLIHNF